MFNLGAWWFTCMDVHGRAWRCMDVRGHACFPRWYHHRRRGEIFPKVSWQGMTECENHSNPTKACLVLPWGIMRWLLVYCTKLSLCLGFLHMFASCFPSLLNVSHFWHGRYDQWCGTSNDDHTDARGRGYFSRILMLRLFVCAIIIIIYYLLLFRIKD